MTTYLSAAAAAGASNIPAMITAGATLAGVALGAVSTVWPVAPLPASRWRWSPVS
jgi:hypothetical protein